jgi:hypothetical protein
MAKFDHFVFELARQLEEMYFFIPRYCRLVLELETHQLAVAAVGSKGRKFGFGFTVMLT